jgi:hypothetical protein
MIFAETSLFAVRITQKAQIHQLGKYRDKRTANGSQCRVPVLIFANSYASFLTQEAGFWVVLNESKFALVKRALDPT